MAHAFESVTQIFRTTTIQPNNIKLDLITQHWPKFIVYRYLNRYYHKILERRLLVVNNHAVRCQTSLVVSGGGNGGGGVY